MRIYFQELTRAKKAAKSLAASTTGVKLSTAQEVLARITGFRNWHDLTENHNAVLPRTVHINRQADPRMSPAIFLSLKLSEELGLLFGDALYALAQMDIPGIHLREAQAYEALWLQLFRETQPFPNSKHSPGTVVRIKSESPGCTGQVAILKQYGNATRLITHKSPNSCVTDFEVVFPKKLLPFFIPARLKLAYGYWTETSGSKVLFSRDYKPIWRLTEGRKPERVQPWLWINNVDEQWFWDDSDTPWRSMNRRKEEDLRLRELGITALPRLVEVLPDLVFNDKLNDIGSAVDSMARRQDPGVVPTSYGLMRESRT